MSVASKIRLVAVVGGSGAGKSWLISRLCRAIGRDACHLQLDDFYRDRSHLPMRRRPQVNFDLPRAVDWEAFERVLRDCAAGRATDVPKYDFATYTQLRGKHRWKPRPIVFVDGLWLLRNPRIRRLFDLTLFLDIPTEVRCDRRRARDVVERGYTPDRVEHQLRTAVVPMHNRFVETQKEVADLVLHQPYEKAAVAELAARLWTLRSEVTPRPARGLQARIEKALLTQNG